MKFEGSIYTPKKKYINLEVTEILFWGGLILMLIILVYFNIRNEWNNDNAIFVLIASTPSVLGMIFSIGSTEKLHGELNGKVEITENFIKVDSKTYLASQIKKLELTIKNYRDERLESLVGVPGPWYSSGVNNSIKFNSDGEDVFLNFRIDSKDEYNLLKKIKNEVNT